MSETPKHTPLPWRHLRRDVTFPKTKSCSEAIESSHPDVLVAICNEVDSHMGAEQNAAYIIRACNNFPELLAALETLLDAYCDGTALDLVCTCLKFDGKVIEHAANPCPTCQAAAAIAKATAPTQQKQPEVD